MTRLFEIFPILEVWVRIIYKFVLSKGIIKNRIVPNEKAQDAIKVPKAKLDRYLDSVGIQTGDVLIVHSSMKGIKGFGLSADELIDILLKRVGKSGMLFMPAYPEYPSAAQSLSYNEMYNNIDTYDVSNTKGWTGYITEVFRCRKDVVRSCFPNNTLAGAGNDIEKIFESELESDLAFGKHSAWNYCLERHAKVLFLGIHAHHSISEIHIAEDQMDSKWPIRGWYAVKHYRIICGDKEIKKDCRVRKTFWNRYMTEYNGCYRLRKEGLLMENMIDNICVSFIPDVKKLTDYVTQRAVKGDLVYFKIPKKYRR